MENRRWGMQQITEESDIEDGVGMKDGIQLDQIFIEEFYDEVPVQTSQYEYTGCQRILSEVVRKGNGTPTQKKVPVYEQTSTQRLQDQLMHQTNIHPVTESEQLHSQLRRQFADGFRTKQSRHQNRRRR